MSRAKSDRKLDDYAHAFEQHGYSRWLIETTGDESRDFVTHYPELGAWTGLVWSMRSSNFLRAQSAL